jgi:hypothetical protein
MLAELPKPDEPLPKSRIFAAPQHYPQDGLLTAPPAKYR